MKQPDETWLLNLVKMIKDHPPAKAAFMIFTIFDGVYNDIPDTIDCEQGCNWCCYSRVDVTELEMKAVESHIRHRFTKPQVDRVIKAAKDIKKKYQQMGKEGRIFSRDACPLLMDGVCSVYESRPLLCRSAFSTNKKACEIAHSKQNHPVPMLIDPKNFVDEMVAAIRIGEGKKDYTMTVVDGILKHFK